VRINFDSLPEGDSERRRLAEAMAKLEAAAPFSLD